MRIAYDATILLIGGVPGGGGGPFRSGRVSLRDGYTHSTMILKFFENFLKRVGKMIHSDRRLTPRHTNPATLTRQYIDRINDPPPSRRARWINAWLGVSGKTE